jgi:hypothetical protein
MAPWNDELQQEYEEFCAIPINSKSSAFIPYPTLLTPPALATVQKYFLETVHSPGKIIAVNLVREDAPITTNPSNLHPS